MVISRVFLPLWIILASLILLAALAVKCWLTMRRVMYDARLFRSVAEGSSDGLVVMERDSRIVWHNAAYARIMGYPDGALVGRYPLTFALPARLALPEEEVRNFRFNESEERFGMLTQVDNIRKDGTEFIHEFSHAALRVGGEPLFLLAGRDITERVAREQALIAVQHKLETQSRTDALTGLSNRGHMQDVLDGLVAAQKPFAVMQIDVNRMKQINDTFGHLAGDAALVHVAQTIRAHLDESALCARVGGDEFVILLPKVSALTPAQRMAEELADLASRTLPWKAAKLEIEISVGVAVLVPSVESSDELLNRSDVALYQAKALRNVRVVGYDDALHRTYTDAQAMERDIVDAVHSNAFTFHFQPIFDVDTGRVEKFEMLVRWMHPDRGLLSPDQFLPHITHLGLTGELDQCVLACAETAFRAFDAAGLTQIGLSVNLSADAFSSHVITDTLLWLVESGCLDPARVSLEILESTALTLAKETLQARLLSRLHSVGFRIFLDDFGMGYAGLAHLAALPCTGLKIDRGLSSAVDTDPTSRAIVTTLVKLANDLGLDVVTEGVETEEQIAIIQRAGSSIFQGYAIARPMPLEDAIQWVTTEAGFATGTAG